MKLVGRDVAKGNELAKKHRVVTKSTWEEYRDAQDGILCWGYIEAMEDITRLLKGIYSNADTPEELAQNLKHVIADREQFVRHSNKNFASPVRP